MPTGFYTRSEYRMMRGELALQSATLKWMLLRSTGTYNFDPDHDYVADLATNGAVEISVASYLRQTVTTPVVTLDDTNNRSKFSSDTVNFSTLEVGQSVSAFVMYQHITNDVDSPLIFFCNGLIVVTCAAPVAAPTTGTITGTTAANPVVVTSATHGLVNGQRVKITGIVGPTALNNRIFTVAGVTTNTFQLTGENGTGYPAYVSGGTWNLVRDVYVWPTRDAIVDGAAVSFGGVTGIVDGNFTAGSSLIRVADLSGAIAALATSNVQSQIILPAALGGGAFTINFNAGGFFYLPGGSLQF